MLTVVLAISVDPGGVDARIVGLGVDAKVGDGHGEYTTVDAGHNPLTSGEGDVL